ncbi:MAG: DUF4139 domain-containing protein [Candidatus Hydrogenedentes bacterium]|nr:DUF4139 domain-containing protein [Candidatus Hydrogenedentota bacterium]
MRNLILTLTLCIATLASQAELQNVEIGSEFVRGSGWYDFDKQLTDPLKASINPGETTLADQTDVAVTAYNNNRALIRDRRSIKLLPGEVMLKFMDVAAQIKPETVSLKSLSSPGNLLILEQNYEFDLMSPKALMDKYVGKQVRLINKSADYTFFEETATLLGNNDGPIYQIGGDIYLGHPGSVVLPKLPEELIAKPSLIWLLENHGTDHEVEVTYLTGGISWKADYVVTLAQDEKTLDLEGWVTLTNESGATYNNAQLKLVAGDVNIVQELRGRGGFGGGAARMAMKAAPMREESFAEYHLYSLARRTTIKQNQTKQVSLLRASGVQVAKAYEFRGQGHYYAQPLQQHAPEKVGVFLELKNEEKNQLGMPLPAGIMRVYQQDSDGMLQFSGEDRIKHTPKDETVRLRLGNAFDVVGERVQTEFKRIANNFHESAYTITLRNHKDTAITIDVVEAIPGDWKILEESHPHVKKDARTAIFTIPVPADGEVELSYRVRVTF